MTAAFATTLVTPTPERAQITTLPLFFVMLGGAVVQPLLPPGTWWQALVALPGAPVGELTQFAFAGGAWEPCLGGLPGLAGLVVWPVVFAVLAMCRFRWDPRA